MSLVTLYTYSLPIQLWLTDPLSAPNQSGPMYNYPINIYKNSSNKLDIVVRNNDRQYVKLIGCKIDFVFQYAETDDTVLIKRAKITDEINGRAQLVLAPGDTENWLVGGYIFQVKITQPDGSSSFLYQDFASNTVGNCQVLPSVGSELLPARQIVGTAFTPTSFDWDMNTVWYCTGALAMGNMGDRTSLITEVVYTTNWHGYVWFQASLDNLSPRDASWFTLQPSPAQDTLEIKPDQMGPICVNFNLNAQWIRVLYRPAPDNLGTFDKLLWKTS
jgi:hypothetical protein